MTHFDLQGDELRNYRPDLDVPSDIGEFWEATLASSPPEPPVFEPVENHLAIIDTVDVTFTGYDGTPVRGWLMLPANAIGGLPVVVQYIGYGGGRGLPHERLLWAAAGYAHFVMDTRGQGSAWGVGHTPDTGSGGEPAHPGFMTRGVADPERYYYRRLFTDAVRAIDAATSHPQVDPEQVAVAGSSQGGGVAIAVASLRGDVRYTMIDVPFLCDFPRATSISPKDPYTEIVRYLRNHRDQVEQVFRTLSYFDGAVLGRKARAEALFSVALMDEVCPPSTVYAAYNWYGGQKSIVEYPYNDHEGGQSFHDLTRLEWLGDRFRLPT
jgi:cephalosporin-C deacetylase